MYLMTCTRPDLAYPLSILAHYVAPGRHRPEHMAATKRVLRYLCSTLGLGLVLGGRRQVVLTGHADASWADDQATQRSSQGYTFSLGSGSVSWRSTRSSSVLGSSCEAEIHAGAMAAQELCWLTYLLTDLGEQPRSPPVLYANIADIFTKALPPGDHQRFCTMLACFALLVWSCVLLFSPTLPMGFNHSCFFTVVHRYSSPATAALGRLILPYLFPELSAFATVEDLVTHLHTSDARYRSALPAEPVAVLEGSLIEVMTAAVVRVTAVVAVGVGVGVATVVAAMSSGVRVMVKVTMSGMLLLLVGSAAAARARVVVVAAGVVVVEAVEAVEVAELVAAVEVVVGLGASVAAVVAAVGVGVGVAMVAAVGVVAAAVVELF
ncbi:unnamed protein product [Closterium sp. NIES-53]